MLTRANTLVVMTPIWVDAVAYLAKRQGWVSAWELADHVYGGHCTRQAPHMLIRRARLAGVPIESNRALGYRLGRSADLVCGSCGSLMVKYEADEPVCYGCVGTAYIDLEVGRAIDATATQQGKAWSEEENEQLRELWPEVSQEEIAARLSRTASSVRAQGHLLGLGRKPYRRSME